MGSYEETVGKFLDVLHVDTVKNVKYVGKYYSGTCVCGQPIKYGYKFVNKCNLNECIVGKRCLNYVFNYIKCN